MVARGWPRKGERDRELSSFAGCNAPRLPSRAKQGHYESWFQRANHPTRPLAFWIRYTRLRPAGDARGMRAAIWAIYFDGEAQRIFAAKREIPWSDCEVSSDPWALRLGAAHLDTERLAGSADGEAGSLHWDLRHEGGQAPLLLLPRRLYRGPFPAAKALVGAPLRIYSGELLVAGRRVDVHGWVGSQNHNWGRRHTDAYAWGQVAGFEDDPEAFLEVTTARTRIGAVWTPAFTLAVLRVDGRELRFDALHRGAQARAHYDAAGGWSFAVRNGAVALSGRIWAPPHAFVALRYDNPPGGDKICLNSKLASCALAVWRPGQPVRTLRTGSRAAFEILTDRCPPGWRVRV